MIQTIRLIPRCDIVFTANCDSMRECVRLALEASANIDGTDLSNKDLKGLDFSKRRLRKIDFRGSDLKGCNFTDASVVDCQFDNSDLAGCRFDGAFLKGSSFLGAYLVGCCFQPFTTPGVVIDLEALRRLDFNAAMEDLFILLRQGKSLENVDPASPIGMWISSGSEAFLKLKDEWLTEWEDKHRFLIGKFYVAHSHIGRGKW